MRVRLAALGLSLIVAIVSSTGCSLVTHPTISSVDDGATVMTKLLSKKYGKSFTLSGLDFNTSSSGNIFYATIVGVGDEPPLSADASVNSWGILEDNYSSLKFKAQMEDPARALCTSAPRVESCVVTMLSPESVERWDQLSLEDFISESPVSSTIVVTYPSGLTDGEYADLAYGMGVALHGLKTRAFLRFRIDGDDAFAINITPTGPFSYTRSMFLDYIDIWHAIKAMHK